MANLPKLRSKEQILGELIEGFLSRVEDVDDLNKGSVITQFFNAVAQSNFKTLVDLISMIDATSIDRASGDSLQRLAADNNVPIYSGVKASGFVNITDTSFTKISSSIYAGQPAPVAGSTKIAIVDASDFKSTGNIYIGRGTENVEGPLKYTSITSEGNGAYFLIHLDTSTPTTKFHNINEEVVMAQGGKRLIRTGSSVKTADTGSIEAVTFKTIADVNILDGEIEVKDVPVLADKAGKTGNVAKNAIVETVGFNFSSSCSNPFAFTNGTDADTDQDIRDRIKAYEAAKPKGTENAIKTATLGATADDDHSVIVSNNIIRKNDQSILVIDDGTGYEPKTNGIGIETVVDGAIGGEKEVQLRQYPVAIARAITLNDAPYNIPDQYALDVEINGVTTTHTFKSSEFKVPSNATGFEVAASINSDTNIDFVAYTANSGKNVVIIPKSLNNNTLKVLNRDNQDANDILNFPTTEQNSILLYKNDVKLNQDGKTADLTTKSQQSWSSTITDGDTLIYSVDNTPPITITLTKEKFQEVDKNTTVNKNTDIAVWTQVLNNLMSGVIVTRTGSFIKMTSARGETTDASIEIIGGTLKDKIFDATAVLKSSGLSSEYSLNTQTGQIELKEQLQPGDKIVAGSLYTRANFTTNSMSAGPSTNGKFWIIVDGATQFIPHGLDGTITTQFSTSGNDVTITATDSNSNLVGFDNIKPGDWLLLWTEDTDLSDGYVVLDTYQGIYRVKTVKRGKLVFDYGSTPPINTNQENFPKNRFVVARSDEPVQLADYPGLTTIGAFIDNINAQLEGVVAELYGSKVRFSTRTYNSTGEIAVLAANYGAKVIGIEDNKIYTNIDSQKAFTNTNDSEIGVPTFTVSTLGSSISDSKFLSSDYLDNSGEIGDFIEILNDYAIDGNNLLEYANRNKGNRAFVTDYDPSNQNLSLEIKHYLESAITPLKENDRYITRSAFSFNSDENITAIVDDNIAQKTFVLPVARYLTVNSHSNATTADFSADDAQSSLDLKDPASFGDFSFVNFDVHRQSTATLTDGNYNLKFKSKTFGPNGDKIRVGLYYPQAYTSDRLTHTFETKEVADVKIMLPASNLKTETWDGTSCFTTSVINTAPNKDIVTYTWRSGTEPNFLAAGSDIQPNNLAILSSESSFLNNNKDISGLVTNVAQTSFTLEIPAGKVIPDELVADSAIVTNKVMTIETPTSHDIKNGDRIGLWDTSSLYGSYPFNAVGYAKNITSTTFDLELPSSVPGGSIASGSSGVNYIIITTDDPHGLDTDKLVKITDAPDYNGLLPIWEIIDAYTFTCVKKGTFNPFTNSGIFDFQSYKPVHTTSSLTSAQFQSDKIELYVNNPSIYNVNDIVKLENFTVLSWNSTTLYQPNEVVNYNGQNYIVKNSNINEQPDIYPIDWEIYDKDFNKSYPIENISGTKLTLTRPETDNSFGSLNTNGAIYIYEPSVKIARALNQTKALQFSEVSTTSQEIVDYISGNLSDYLEVNLGTGDDGSKTITTSTEDVLSSTNYLGANILELKTFVNNNKIEIKVDSEIVAGSEIELALNSLNQYDGNYIVIKSKEFTAPTHYWLLTLQSKILAKSTSTTTLTGTLTGTIKGLLLQDGLNSVASQDLSSLSGSPMFTMKYAWDTIPEVGEEIRLVAKNSDQLTRFWNNLIVTGFSNVGAIDNSYNERDLQLSTDTFGLTGSIEIVGGKANNNTIALIGSGFNYQDKIGYITVPYNLSSSLITNGWVKLQQVIRGNKITNISKNTQITLTDRTMEIVGGAGSFQTKRATTQDATTIIRSEKHGDFMSFSRIGGASLGLIAAGVKEGDWVVIKNDHSSINAYDPNTTYNIGDAVIYGNKRYYAVSASDNIHPVFPSPVNTWDADTEYSQYDTVLYENKAYRSNLSSVNIGNQPDVDSGWDLVWEVREWDTANEGIFQVVRTFGDDMFWIKNDNAIENMVWIGRPENLAFYSYDSIMPGDTITIADDILGHNNIGRYTVVDENFSTGYEFPSSSKLYIDSVTKAFTPISSKLLGNQYLYVNIEEKDPLVLYKRIYSVAPTSNNLALVMFDTYNLINKISESKSAYLTTLNKLAFPITTSFGIDAYKAYTGLIKKANSIVYGNPLDPYGYSGVRAAGTNIDIQAALIKRVSLSLSIRLKTGLPLSQVQDSVKGVVAGYVNSLNVGSPVVLSRVIEAASAVNGIISVVVTDPTYNSANDTIFIAANEKAMIVNPDYDITISSLS